MAKQDPQVQGAIPLSDMRLYRVTLVVAIPDYGMDNQYGALDAIVPTIDDQVQVLSMTEEELLVVPAVATTVIAQVPVKAQVATNTVPDDEDAFDMGTLFGNVASGDIVEPTAKDKQYAAERAAKATHPAKGKKAKASKPKARKHKKAYKPRSEAVIMRTELVYAALQTVGYASADELAALTKVPTPLVYNCLYALHEAKKISANKTAGKVRWSYNNN
jgi:hypothetical protein